MARKKTEIAATLTLPEAQELMHQLADRDAKVRELIAKQDQEMAKIREKYAAKMADLKEACTEIEARLQSFAEANREQLFTTRKSLDWNNGTLGFRTGTPALKTRKGYQWAGVLELVKSRLPDYVRVKEEVMKDRLLADRATLTDAVLAEVGIEVTQSETFFIEIKTEAEV